MSHFVQTWNALSGPRKIILVGAVIVTVAMVLLIARLASKPNLALLYAGLDQAAAGEVVSALEQMGVESEIRNDAIYVPVDDRDRVRLELAADSLPRMGQDGYELLDELSGFSATSEMFSATYWRAKEGELARTIVSAADIISARVHLGVPANRPFDRSGPAPTASVTVGSSAAPINAERAMAIRYMVALAVPGLAPDQVAVVDANGRLILGPGENGLQSSATSEADRRARVLEARIKEVLADIVGPEKLRVSATVETNTETVIQTETIIDPDSKSELSREVEESSSSESSSQQGVTIEQTLPAGAEAENPTDQSNSSELREINNYGYTTIEKVLEIPPGSIRRISVAVVVDGITSEDASGNRVWEERPPEFLERIGRLVNAAIGFDETRGDVVEVSSLEFLPTGPVGELAEADPLLNFLERNAMALVQIAVLAVVTIVVALAIIRPLLRPAESGDGAVEGEVFESDLGIIEDLGAGELAELPQAEEQPLPEQLRQQIGEQPDDAVSLLLEWLEPETEEQVEAA